MLEKYTNLFAVYESPPPLLVYEAPLIRTSAYTKLRSTECKAYSDKNIGNVKN